MRVGEGGIRAFPLINHPRKVNGIEHSGAAEGEPPLLFFFVSVLKDGERNASEES